MFDLNFEQSLFGQKLEKKIKMKNQHKYWNNSNHAFSKNIFQFYVIVFIGQCIFTSDPILAPWSTELHYGKISFSSTRYFIYISDDLVKTYTEFSLKIFPEG